MEYSIYKKLATKYVEENHGGLNVLSSYNPYVRDKVLTHMTNLMLAECGQDIKEKQKAITESKKHAKRFFEECLK